MKLTNNIEIIDLALKIDTCLVIADLHIGYEEALNKQGLLIPRFQLKELTARLERILKKFKPETVIINGDIKHEFGTISFQEWRDTLRILDLIEKHCKKIILIKGNHDTILGPIAKRKNISIIEHYRTGSIYITHGHKLPKALLKNIKTIVIAHEHPAVGLRKGRRFEMYKCFLKGKWKNRQLIVQPSFNFVTQGTDLLREQVLSPFLQKSLNNFDVFIVEKGKVYDFGKLKNLKRR